MAGVRFNRCDKRTLREPVSTTRIDAYRLHILLRSLCRDKKLWSNLIHEVPDVFLKNP